MARPASSGSRRPDPLPHQNGDPHGQAGDNHGDSLEQHAAGGHAGDVRRLGKLAHHQQVHAAVERLQEQCEENRNGKTDQRAEDVPLRQAGAVVPFYHSS